MFQKDLKETVNHTKVDSVDASAALIQASLLSPVWIRVLVQQCAQLCTVVAVYGSQPVRHENMEMTETQPDMLAPMHEAGTV